MTSLDLQLSRICEDSGASLHDADFYMVLLRRIWRILEETAKINSRVANLKGKYRKLYQKIKIRDHFEHKDKDMIVPSDKELLVKTGVLSKESKGNIQIQICLVKGKDSISIISGARSWDIKNDHQIFCELIKEFIKLFPFD